MPLFCRYNQPYSHKPANTTGKSVHRNNDDFVVTSYTNDHKVPPPRPAAPVAPSSSPTLFSWQRRWWCFFLYCHSTAGQGELPDGVLRRRHRHQRRAGHELLRRPGHSDLRLVPRHHHVHHGPHRPLPRRLRLLLGHVQVPFVPSCAIIPSHPTDLISPSCPWHAAASTRRCTRTCTPRAGPRRSWCWASCRRRTRRTSRRSSTGGRASSWPSGRNSGPRSTTATRTSAGCWTASSTRRWTGASSCTRGCARCSGRGRSSSSASSSPAGGRTRAGGATAATAGAPGNVPR